MKKKKGHEGNPALMWRLNLQRRIFPLAKLLRTSRKCGSGLLLTFCIEFCSIRFKNMNDKNSCVSQCVPPKIGAMYDVSS